MQTTFEQEQTILWSLLHEPGDALARLIFEQRGIAALADFKRKSSSESSCGFLIEMRLRSLKELFAGMQDRSFHPMHQSFLKDFQTSIHTIRICSGSQGMFRFSNRRQLQSLVLANLVMLDFRTQLDWWQN